MTKIDGFGLGLRHDHYQDFLVQKPKVDWLEILSENYMVPGGKPLYFLDLLRRDFPMVMHGVSLSIGSTDPLNLDYLRELKSLIQRVQPSWVSDHLCWTSVGQVNFHDLLPMPHTEAALTHLSSRIHQVQDFLGQQIVLENTSTYVAFEADEMSESNFVSELAKRADCKLLLDVNNIYVNSINLGFDARCYIDAIPSDRVVQIHLAGHEDYGDYIIDTHDQLIAEPVLQLYQYAIEKLGSIPTMIERDDNIPPLVELLVELDQVKQIARSVLSKKTA